MKTRTIKNITHYLYENEEEFRDEQGDIELIENWKEGKEGDWVKCDDGQVCQVLRRRKLKVKGTDRQKHHYVRTIIGSFVCKDKVKMSGDMRVNMYSFGSQDKTAWQVQRERVKPTKHEFLFAKYVAKGDNFVDAYLQAYPTNNRRYAEMEATILLKDKRIVKLIREEIDKVMNEADITPLYILNKMKDIIESIDAKDSDKVSLLKELVTISGMKDTEKRSESVTVFQGFTKDQLAAIGGNDTKKLAEGYREAEV